MRLCKLRLLRYGHFENRELDFSDSGLTIVFGPNEAGKSTSLAAIADLLYGFGHYTDYSFRFETRLLRVGATLRNRAGEEITFIRRKGNKDTLLDPEEVPLPDSALAPFLGRTGREFFERAFGLSHERLRQGGEAIARAEGDLGESLFEAGSGIQGLADIQQKLAGEADGIFAPRRSRERLLYQTLTEYETALSGQKQASLRRSEWVQADSNLKAARDALQSAREKLRELQARQAKLTRLERVLPILRELDTLRGDLARLGPESLLPPDAGQRLTRANQQRHHSARALAEARQQLDEVLRQIEECPVDEPLLAAFGTIGELFERASGIEERLAQLPALETQVRTLSDGIVARARELDLPVEHDRPVLPKKLDLTTLNGLASEREKLDREHEKASSDEAHLRGEAERLHDGLAALGDLPDTREDEAVAQELRAAIARLGDTRAIERSIQRLERKIGELRAALTWWKGTPEALLTAVLPTRARIDQAGRDLDRAAQALESARSRHQDACAALRKAQARLTAHRERATFHTDEDLARARGRRLRAWMMIRGVLDGHPAPSPEELAALGAGPELVPAFERLTETADAVADARLEHAEEIARHKQLQEAEAAAALDAETARQNMEAAEAACREQMARWRELWAPLGVEPLTPAEMKEGLGLVDALKEAAEDREQSAAQLQSIRDARSAILARLRDMAARLGVTPEESDDAQTLLARLQAALDGRKERREEAGGLKARLDELRRQQERHRRVLAGLGCRMTEWAERWEEACARVGLSPRSSLWQVRQSIETWGDLARMVEELDRCTRQIAESRDAVHRYAAAVAELVERLEGADAVSGLDDPGRALVRLRSLYAEGNRAQRDAERRKELLARRSRLESAVSTHEEEVRAADGELRSLREMARVASEEELPEAVALAEKQAKLRERIEDAQRRLAQAGGGAGEQELREQAGEISLDTLSAELTELAGEIEAQERVREDAARHEEQARAALEALEGKAGGHQHAQAVEHALARMGVQVRDYLRLHAASLMLSRGIERLSDRHKNPILLRAGAWFRDLTGGSFQGLETDFDSDDRPTIVGARPGGGRVFVQGMSDGTRDQLYLALRMAFVEHYCSSEEPLPFIGDDLFVHFDDERTVAGLRLLAGLTSTQVILFTHHQHVVDLARQALDGRVHVISLDGPDAL